MKDITQYAVWILGGLLTGAAGFALLGNKASAAEIQQEELPPASGGGGGGWGSPSEMQVNSLTTTTTQAAAPSKVLPSAHGVTRLPDNVKNATIPANKNKIHAYSNPKITGIKETPMATNPFGNIDGGSMLDKLILGY